MVGFLGYVCIAVAAVSQVEAVLNQRQSLNGVKDSEAEDAGVLVAMQGLAYVHMQVQRKSYARPWEMAVAELVGLPAIILDEWSDAPSTYCPNGDLLIVPGGHSTQKEKVRITHPLLIQKVEGKVIKYYPHRLLTLICSDEKLVFKGRESAKMSASLYNRKEGGTAITIDNDLLPIRSGGGGSLTHNYNEVLKLIKGSGLNSDVLTCARLSPQPSIKLGFFVQSGVVTGYMVEGCLVPMPNLDTSVPKAPMLSVTVIMPVQGGDPTQVMLPQMMPQMMPQMVGQSSQQGKLLAQLAQLPGFAGAQIEVGHAETAQVTADAKTNAKTDAKADAAAAQKQESEAATASAAANDVAEKVVASAMKDAVQAMTDGHVTNAGEQAMRDTVKAIAEGAVEGAVRSAKDTQDAKQDVLARRVNGEQSSDISASGEVVAKADAAAVAVATDELAKAMSPVVQLLETGADAKPTAASASAVVPVDAAAAPLAAAEGAPASLVELSAEMRISKVLQGHANSLGTTWTAVENEQLQKFLGLPKGGGGILVGKSAPSGPFGYEADAGITRGSLITKLDGNEIAPSGSLICTNSDPEICEGELGRRTIMEYVAKRKEVEVTFRKWSGVEGKLEDKEQTVDVQLAPRDPLLRRYDGEDDGSLLGVLKPSYVLIGGMIFTRATLPMVMDLGDRGPVQILPTLRKRMLEKWKANKKEEIVVLVGSLESEANKFYSQYVMQELATINGEEVKSLEEVVRKMKDLAADKPDFVEIGYQHYGPTADMALSGGVAGSLVTWNMRNDRQSVMSVQDPVPDIVLSHGDVHMANMQVLRSYFVPAVISEDLCEAAGFSMDGFERMKQEQGEMQEKGEKPTELPMLGYLDPMSAQWCHMQKRAKTRKHAESDLEARMQVKGEQVNGGPDTPEAAPLAASIGQILSGSDAAPGSLLQFGESTDELLDVFHELRTHGGGVAFDDEAMPETGVEAQRAAEADGTVVSDVTKELLSGLALKHRSLLETGMVEGRISQGTTVGMREANKVPLERVVKIYNTGAKQSFVRPWGRSGNMRSTGSGIIIVKEDVMGERAHELLGNKNKDGDSPGWEFFRDPQTGEFHWPEEFGDGLIITNAHVVESGLQFHIQRMDEDVKFPADVLAVGRDVDMAVLRLKPNLQKDGPEGLSFATKLFSPVINKDPSTELSVTLTMPALRDKVMVVGFPRSGDAASITEGVVSRVAGFGYVFNLRDDWINHSPPQFVIQVDAAINPGNSGGPVFNAEGQFCGLAFASLGGSDGMGYVIPTAVVKSVLPKLLMNAAKAAKGTHVQMVNMPTVPEAGFTWRGTENPGLRKYLGIDKNIRGGVVVQSVSPYSAARGLLEHGDVIVKINGKDISAEGEVLIQHEQKPHVNANGTKLPVHSDHSLDLRVPFDTIISAHMLHGAIHQAKEEGGMFKEKDDGDAKIHDIISASETVLHVLKRSSRKNNGARPNSRLSTEAVLIGCLPSDASCRQEDMIAFKPIPPLAPRYEGVDAFPSWFVTGGLVWSRFTMPLLEEWLGYKQALPCLTANTALHQWKKHDNHQVIVLVDTLADPLNMYLDLPKMSILQSVNGVPIESMQDLIKTVTQLWTTPDAHVKFRFRRGRFSDTDLGIEEGKEEDPTRTGSVADDEANGVPDAVFMVRDIMDEMPILENYGVPYPAGGWMTGTAVSSETEPCGDHCGNDYETGHDLLELYCDGVLGHMLEPAVKDAEWLEMIRMKTEDCRQWLQTTRTGMSEERICMWRAVSDVRKSADPLAAVQKCKATAGAELEQQAAAAKQALAQPETSASEPATPAKKEIVLPQAAPRAANPNEIEFAETVPKASNVEIRQRLS